MSDNKEEKRASKLSSLIGQAKDNPNSSQYTVHYSENNWETCEEVNLIVNDDITINELMDKAIQKFKTELYYDNIDKRRYVVRIFKKKKKIPNIEYPVCNLDSKVSDFGKSHFCLVENEEKEENEVEKDDINENIQINKEKEKLTNNDNVVVKNVVSLENKHKTNQNNNFSDNSNNTGKTIENKEEGNKPNCRSCFIF